MNNVFSEITPDTEVNEIIDNTFMDKCVSTLIKDDFYLFDVRNVKDRTSNEDVSYMFYYKDGVVCIGKIVKDQVKMKKNKNMLSFLKLMMVNIKLKL